jgi:hypothetical protein
MNHVRFFSDKENGAQQEQTRPSSIMIQTELSDVIV